MDSHQQQTQFDFLTACGVSQEPSSIAVALGLRRAIAKFGRIPESYIRSEYTFTDLEPLPNWSARIDIFFKRELFERLLETETRRPFPPKLMNPIPDPESNNRITLGEFIAKVVSRLANDPTTKL
jgi:hypothetical protein